MKKLKKKLSKQKTVAKKEFWNNAGSKFDPNGSYTGTPDGQKMPVQDADDL